jgi:hypothetical protein
MLLALGGLGRSSEVGLPRAAERKNHSPQTASCRPFENHEGWATLSCVMEKSPNRNVPHPRKNNLPDMVNPAQIASQPTARLRVEFLILRRITR